MGSRLIDAEALNAVMEGLSAEDFYDPRHRKVFEVMESMAARNVAVDSPHIQG
ncbi:MAG: DnaB-like helicase N-terminal domain-containing protein [Cloacibacillus evryensis]